MDPGGNEEKLQQLPEFYFNPTNDCWLTGKATGARSTCPTCGCAGSWTLLGNHSSGVIGKKALKHEIAGSSGRE